MAMNADQIRQLLARAAMMKKDGPLAVLMFDFLDKFNKQAVQIKGDQGEKGDKGDKGDTGAVGPQGRTGLTGEAGPRGYVGEKGYQGPQGVPGQKGDTGPQGEQGTPGSAGKSLTAIDVRDLLQTLDGEERLDAKYIKNMPRAFTALPAITLPGNRGGSGSGNGGGSGGDSFWEDAGDNGIQNTNSGYVRVSTRAGFNISIGDIVAPITGKNEDLIVGSDILLNGNFAGLTHWEDLGATVGWTTGGGSAIFTPITIGPVDGVSGVEGGSDYELGDEVTLDGGDGLAALTVASVIGGITEISITNGGAGHAIDDVITLYTGGEGTPAEITVTAVDGGGAITAFTISDPGTGQQLNTGNGVIQNGTTGSGTGFTGQLENGVGELNQANITNPGSGYSINTVYDVLGGSGTGAQMTITSIDTGNTVLAQLVGVAGQRYRLTGSYTRNAGFAGIFAGSNMTFSLEDASGDFEVEGILNDDKGLVGVLIFIDANSFDGTISNLQFLPITPVNLPVALIDTTGDFRVNLGVDEEEGEEAEYRALLIQSFDENAGIHAAAIYPSTDVARYEYLLPAKDGTFLMTDDIPDFSGASYGALLFGDGSGNFTFSNNFHIDTNPYSLLIINGGGSGGRIIWDDLSSSREFRLPNKDGTFAMLSDVASPDGDDDEIQVKEGSSLAGSGIYISSLFGSVPSFWGPVAKDMNFYAGAGQDIMLSPGRSTGAILSVSVENPGSGYQVDDIVDINAQTDGHNPGNTDPFATGGQVRVTSVDGGGEVTGISIESAGEHYVDTGHTTNNGSGSGLRVHVDSTELDPTYIKIIRQGFGAVLKLGIENITSAATQKFILGSGLIGLAVEPPGSAANNGKPGMYAYDEDYFYICIDTDTWMRGAIATW